jgi:hypothetical protein
LLLAAAAWSPLLLHGLTGPTAGSPVGLGLLATLATPVAIVAVMLGAVCCAVNRAGRR